MIGEIAPKIGAFLQQLKALEASKRMNAAIAMIAIMRVHGSC